MNTATVQPQTLVRCETCHKTFAVQSNSFVEREGDVETVGIACPHCTARVIAYRTNGAIRNLQAKMQIERKKAESKIRSGVPENKAYRKARQAKDQLERAMAAFNGR